MIACSEGDLVGEEFNSPFDSSAFGDLVSVFLMADDDDFSPELVFETTDLVAVAPVFGVVPVFGFKFVATFDVTLEATFDVTELTLDVTLEETFEVTEVRGFRAVVVVVLVFFTVLVVGLDASGLVVSNLVAEEVGLGATLRWERGTRGAEGLGASGLVVEVVEDDVVRVAETGREDGGNSNSNNMSWEQRLNNKTQSRNIT